MRISLVLALFFILNHSPISGTASLMEPDVNRLFSGIQNCELNIVRSGMEPSDMYFTLFLPTTIYRFPSTTSENKILVDVSKVRVSPCRIIYSDNPLAIYYGLLI